MVNGPLTERATVVSVRDAVSAQQRSQLYVLLLHRIVLAIEEIERPVHLMLLRTDLKHRNVDAGRLLTLKKVKERQLKK